MTDKILKLVQPPRIDASMIFDDCREHDFKHVVVIGHNDDGTIRVDANCGEAVGVWLLEHAKHILMFGGEE